MRVWIVGRCRTHIISPRLLQRWAGAAFLGIAFNFRFFAHVRVPLGEAKLHGSFAACLFDAYFFSIALMASFICIEQPLMSFFAMLSLAIFI